jgi:hypothetical protein
MLRLAFEIEDGDGPRRVDVGPSSLVAWERKTGRRVSDFAEGIGAEDMAWLCWHADKKAGNVTVTFDQYLDTLIDLSDVAPPKALSDGGPSEG